LPKSKLKKKDKDLIYKLYKEENFPQKNLAQLYDTSQSTISNVIKQKRYEENVKELKDIIIKAAEKGFEDAAKEKLEKSKNLLEDSRHGQSLLE